MSVKVTINETSLMELLNKWRSRMTSVKQPMADILEQQLLDAQHFVGTTKSFWGEAWAPMRPSTIKRGRDPSTIMVKSGRLLRSLSKGATENIFEVENWGGMAGSAAPNAAYQQYGAKRGRKRPPRVYLAWSENRADNCLEIISDYLCPED